MNVSNEKIVCDTIQDNHRERLKSRLKVPHRPCRSLAIFSELKDHEEKFGWLRKGDGSRDVSAAPRTFWPPAPSRIGLMVHVVIELLALILGEENCVLSWWK